MTKADLISIVADRLKITQVQSSIIVEAALRSVVNALRNGEEVEIRGFGSFRFNEAVCCYLLELYFWRPSWV